MITLNNVSYYQSNKLILDDISVNFEYSKITCVLGQSGSGKTSLLRVISGLCAYSGHVSFLLDGVESSNVSFPSLTYVMQGFKLFPHLNVQDNLNLVLEANSIEINNDEIKHYFELFSLVDISSKKAYELSVGQRQRVALIRALLLKPKILLLDEVTSALDIQLCNLVSNVLSELKSKMCILMVTHSIGMTRKLADKVVFIDNGKLIEFGDISILDSPKTESFASYLGLDSKELS